MIANLSNTWTVVLVAGYFAALALSAFVITALSKEK